MGDMSHEAEIFLPSRYDALKSRLFGVDLVQLMGADGRRGLPRAIVDAIAYIRSDGIKYLGS
jgi:hypothetical protein